MDSPLSLVDYSRQQQMDSDMQNNLRLDQAHIIVGCGGVGFWLGMFLAMNGGRRLILCDGQSIDSTNLNRIPVPQTFLGRNKAIALRKTIKMLRPECLVSVVPLHVTDDAGFNSLVLLANQHDTSYGRIPRAKTVWDCTDDARVQRKLSAYCTSSNMWYRKLGYEGYKIGYYTQMESVWFDEATYQPGYRTSRANAMSSALTAAFGVFARGLEGYNDVGLQIDPQDMTIDLKTVIRTGGRQCTSTTAASTTTPSLTLRRTTEGMAMAQGIAQGIAGGTQGTISLAQINAVTATTR